MSIFSLNGNWKLRNITKGTAAIPAKLPGDNYSANLDAEVIPDPYYRDNEKCVQYLRDCDWEYSRVFSLGKEFLDHDSITLDLSMVDTFAEIKINDVKVGETGNMFAGYKFNVRKELRVGENSIVITFRSSGKISEKRSRKLPFEIPMHPNNKVPHFNLIRKTQCHAGWDWGICLIVSGIYDDINLTAVNTARIDNIRVLQKHKEGHCDVTAIAELTCSKNGEYKISFCFNGEERKVAAILTKGFHKISVDFAVENPHLWYPNGYGEAYLYDLGVATADETQHRRIGLRTIEFVHKPDKIGACFYFCVNGIPVFAKGANWVPADAMPQRQTYARYENLLESARLANMNMIRVWGGGQFEKKDFYDICDEKGLLIWQDLMFSCSLYPSTPDFIKDVETELEYQIPRLQYHACLALYCGNNEVLGALKWYPCSINNRDLYLVNYDRLNNAIKNKFAELDSEHVLWPGSPCGGVDDYSDGWQNDCYGDMHYWEVWAGGKKFDSYLTKKPRFCSEFGYQSFPSAEQICSFTADSDQNIFSPVMDVHQKCCKGNAPIIAMFGNYFRMPKTFENFLYLSQVQQAIAIKTGVEYWRTLRPVCMGTLFWQLNDVWPSVSWSSIEYGGCWKQLQYHAKRFYAPLIGTVQKNSEGDIELWAVNDKNKLADIKMLITVRLIENGKTIKLFKFNNKLNACSSLCLGTIKMNQIDCAVENYFIFIETTGIYKDETLTHSNIFFPTVWKNYEFPKAKIESEIEERDGKLMVTLKTDHPAFFVHLECDTINVVFSNSSFTLLPDKPITVEAYSSDEKITAKDLEENLTVCDLRGSY